LQTAAKMQEELLPASSSKYLNVTIDWLFCPSSVVSGDIFNFFRLDETHIGFYSLDVAGHGVSAAMMSFTLFRLLTTEMQRGSPLKRPLTKKPYYQIVPPAQKIGYTSPWHMGWSTRLQRPSN
jgi:phosphoserine phosphatase RsbU/P